VAARKQLPFLPINNETKRSSKLFSVHYKDVTFCCKFQKCKTASIREAIVRITTYRRSLIYCDNSSIACSSELHAAATAMSAEDLISTSTFCRRKSRAAV